MKTKTTLRSGRKFRLSCALFIGLLILGCSSEAESNEGFLFTDIEGVILRPVSCTRDTYWVEIDKIMDENGNSNLIGAIDLPEEFKQEGLRISFSMRKFEDKTMACVADRPLRFYELKNITPKP